MLFQVLTWFKQYFIYEGLVCILKADGWNAFFWCSAKILPTQSRLYFHNRWSFKARGRSTRGCNLNKGLVFEVKLTATNLIDFQAGRGFAGLSEATMRKVCQELK